MILGSKVTLPQEVIFDSSRPSRWEMVSNYGAFVRELQNKLNLAHEIARGHLKKAAKNKKPFTIPSWYSTDTK